MNKKKQSAYSGETLLYKQLKKDLEKNKITPKDWRNLSVISLKMKIETAIFLFAAIENTVGAHTSPDVWEMLDKAKRKTIKSMNLTIENSLDRIKIKGEGEE